MRGFTLIELLVTMVGLAILSVCYFPRDSFRSFHLSTAARIVEQDLRYAKELASLTKIKHGVDFVENNPYTVFRSSTETPATHPLTGNPLITRLGDAFRNIEVLSTVRFLFDSYGRPILGGGGTVRIGNGYDTITIEVVPNTGVVRRL